MRFSIEVYTGTYAPEYKDIDLSYFCLIYPFSIPLFLSVSLFLRMFHPLSLSLCTSSLSQVVLTIDNKCELSLRVSPICAVIIYHFQKKSKSNVEGIAFCLLKLNILNKKINCNYNISNCTLQ